MMKRDLQKFKYVAGEKVENKVYENKYNKTQNYRCRDINEERLPKWDLIYNFSERSDINSKHHEQSQNNITKFKPARKNFGQQQNLLQVQTEEKKFKPCVRIVEQQISAARDHSDNQRRVRDIPKISDELKIINEKLLLLPHMRTITPNGRPINVKHNSQFCNSEELDIINQMHTELPHMRTKTPNGRKIQTPAQHVLSNETDFINQKKYLLPSMQNISPNVKYCLTERNKSQFTLAWDS